LASIELSGKKKIRATVAKEVGMKNPAEETTVRPNRNQTTGKLNQPDPTFQLVLHEKEPQHFPHHNAPNLAMTIQPKPETGSPFFGNHLVKIAMKNRPRRGRRAPRHPEIWKLRTFQSGFLAYLLPA
jgi:hypothetical protein